MQNMQSKQCKQSMYYVVGDRFASFSENDRIVSAAKLIDLCQSGVISAGSLIVMGQGLSQSKRSELRDQLLRDNLTSAQNILDTIPQTAGRQLCHKHEEKNALVSVPRKISDRSYELELHVDQDCAEMSDHMTGQHIQGMVLVEAARQSYLSVAEAFYCDPKVKVYFVLETFNISYERFLFPLPATIELAINDFQRNDRGVLRFDATARFMQNGHLTCTVQGKYRVYAKDFLAKKEQQMASEAVAHYMGELGNSQLRQSLISALSAQGAA